MVARLVARSTKVTTTFGASDHMTKTTTTRKKIGLALVNSLPLDTTAWDSDLKGFCIRRQKSDAVTYLLKTRVAGKTRWFTIGRHGQATPDGLTWQPETARKRALQILANPAIADLPAPPSRDTSFATVADEFLTKHAAKKKPRTQQDYANLIRLYLKPAFGSKPIRDITKADVREAHASWDARRQANYAVSLLSTLMNWAEDHGYRDEDTNPCRRIARNKEQRRQRFLTDAELAELGKALDNAERDHLVGPYAIAALRLLFLTGARLSEILTLEWSHIDFERELIFLPDSKTGQKSLP